MKDVPIKSILDWAKEDGQRVRAVKWSPRKKEISDEHFEPVKHRSAA